MARQKKSGIKIREEKRDKLEEKRFSLACELIDKHIDLTKIAASEDKQRTFDLMWLKFDTNLSTNKYFKDVKRYSTSYNHAVKYCQSRIEDKNIDIGFPKLIIQSSRAKSFRTQEWFNDGKRVLDFYLNWAKGLENKKTVDITVSDILFTLIFHSAILKAPVLQEILDQIIGKRLKLEQISGLPTITVIVKDKAYHTNTYKASEAVHQAQVFISPLSAHIIQSYNKEQKNTVMERDRNLTIYKRYQSIQLIQANQGNEIELGLKRFLMGAVYVLENHFFFDLPEHTWYIMTGKENTYSLATSNWQSLIYNIQHNENQKQEEFNSILTNIDSNSQAESSPCLVVEIAKLLRKDIKDNNAKLSEKKLIKELDEIYNRLKSGQSTLQEKAIVGWLLSKARTCKVSSVQTYSNTITSRWLALTQDTNLKSYQEEDFITLYSEMIELSKTTKAKNSVATLINEIHQYMVKHYHTKPMAPLITSDKPHHKVGYISEQMFQAILDKINSLTTNVDEKQALSLALILGHRCGLRIGEIVKIRLRDVAETQNYLEIRNNKFGNNKSLSALRRVLLAQLLTESDIKLIKRVYIKRSGDKGQTLIASQDGMSYNAQTISKMLTHLIKEVTGLSYLTTHHLRHSCLTNFQLMSFLYDKDYQFNGHPSTTFLKSLLPYESAQAASIVNHFETNLAYKKIYALAGIAGHATPSTTFSSYVHFTDIQVGLLLWQTNFKIAMKHNQILKIPRRQKFETENMHLSINEYLIDKLKLPYFPKPMHSKILNDDFDKKIVKVKKYSFDEVHQVLEAYTQKGDYENLMHIYDVSQETFETWHHNAKRLRDASEFQTRKGNPRLFDINNKGGLLPIKDRYNDDRKIMMRMTEKFRSLYLESDDKKPIHQFIYHTLTHSQNNKNFIKFNCAVDLYNYLQVIRKLVYKKDIRLSYYNYAQAAEKDQNAWDDALKDIPISQRRNMDNAQEDSFCKNKRQIRVELSLASQTEVTRIKNRANSVIPIKQWNVRTIQIFSHYVFIMIGERVKPTQGLIL
ncbi:tyrosine-type recombinase/integrase [Psychrobacter sp. HII-4]|uniref:tyrosine-type recombinase/integrase n=1 Tax=Psychrobacter TaxID=497 RepID=UPI00191A62E3|nr:site-specific integrase [Psychrobacter sp. HII-4]